MASSTYTVHVRADTSSAKASLQDLQSQLNSLASVPVSVDATGLQSAKTAILELGQNLQTAMNPNTGKLDLSVFSRQLKEQNRSILDYKNALFSMGTQGQQAFLSLSNAIASAEAPTNRLNAKILKFGQTIKNTINWQISSMMIHGVLGQIQGAINYAEKLNQSLNNIQIITGQNNEKMAEFARQANQTARQLSTTTTEYTNASLIYYQQGLNDKEVAARTETTLKMANVTRQSAQVVSDQMTAIWNNFDDGTQSLEHYADVITALGAATASSSAEIAGGLEKFAAIAKTVGLSYDYATTALATIVATTRQSEDTVGTGLRTLFARLEGLSLGETLEDGVNLNKYSSALAKVGVNIQDQYGQIKDMDQILDELGAKWGTISKEQQIALAQTVGGVRQYTNLIALMDNWQFFQRNLQVAQGADGTLQTQAERYAEGWEAARKRVRSATEGIYDALIDDQAIIKVTNVFAGFLDVINGLVAGFGGLKGIIPIVGALLMNSFAKNMPQFLGDIANNFRVLTGRGARDMTNMQGNLTGILEGLQRSSTDEVYKLQLQKIIDTNKMNRSLAMNANRMSQTDQDAYRQKILAREAQNDALIMAAQQIQKNDLAYDKLASSIVPKVLKPTKEEFSAIKAGEIPERYRSQIEQALSSDSQLSSLRGARAGRAYNATQIEAAIQRRTEASNELTRRINGKEITRNTLQRELSDPEFVKKLSAETLTTKKADLKAAEEALKQDTVYQGYLKERNRLQEEIKEHTKTQADNAQAISDIDKQILTREREVGKEVAQQTVEKEQNESLNTLLEKSGKKSEIPQDILKELNGKALTTENLKSIRENGILTSRDQAALETAYAAYGAPLRQLGQQKGAYVTAQKQIEAFEKELQDEKVSSGGKIDKEAYAKKAEEFTKNWNEAVDKAGLDKSMKLDAKSLLPEDGNIEEAVKGTVEKIKSTVAAQTGKDSELNKKETETRGVMEKAGIGGTTQNDIFRNGQERGEQTFLSGMTGRPSQQIESAQATQSGITTAMTAASALTMMVSTLNSSAKNLNTIFDSTASGTERFGAVLSEAASLLMTFALVTKLANDETIKGVLQKGAANTTGVISNVLGKMGSSPGLVGLIASIAMLAFGAVKGVIDKQQQQTKEAQQADIDLGNETYEKLTSSKQLIQSQTNLINAYDAAAKAVQEGTATEKELQQAKEELINSLLEQTDQGYSNANAVAYAYAGDTAGVQSQIDTNRLLQIQQTRSSLQARSKAQEKKLYDANIKSNYLYGLSGSDDEFARIARSVLGPQAPLLGVKGGSSAEEVYQGYQNAIKVRDALVEQGFDTNDKRYIALSSYISSLSEAAEAYGEYRTQIEELDIEALALGDTLDGYYIGNANLAIKDIKSYNEYRKTLIDAEAERAGYIEGTEEYKKLEQSVDAYLGTLSSVTGNDLGNLQHISTGVENVIDYQTKRQGLNEEQQAILRDTLIQAYQQYGDAIFQIGTHYEIPISFKDPTKEFESVLNLLKSTAEKNRIQVQLDLVSNFNLNETSSSAEWGKFVTDLDHNLWADIFGKGFDLNSFSALDSESRSRMLQQYTTGLYNRKYESGGILDQNNIDLQSQRLLDEKNVKDTEEQVKDIYNNYFHARGRGAANRKTTIDTNLPLLENIYDDLYDEEGNLKAGAKISEEQRKELDALGLMDFDEEKIKQVHEYAEAVTAYNTATQGLQGTDKLIEANRAELEAWLATGFRQKLAGEAEAFGLDYDEIQQYASVLRDQGLFDQPDAMSMEEYTAEHEKLLTAREDLYAQRAAGSISEEEYNSAINGNTKALEKLEEEYHADIKASEEFAIAQMRVEKGIENLKSNWTSWSKTLKNTKKNTWENTKEFIALRKALADILNQDPSSLSKDFIDLATSLGIVDKAATGTEEGTEALQKFAFQASVLEQSGESLENISNLSDFQSKFSDAIGYVGADFETFAQEVANTEIGLPIPDTGGFIDAFVQARLAAGDSLSDIESQFEKFGVELTPTYQTVPADAAVNTNATYYKAVTDEWGAVTGYEEAGADELETLQEQGGLLKLTYQGRKTGGGGGDNSSGGGGGKKEKDHKKPDTGTRYHTIKAKQSNNTQNKSEVNRKKERAFGAEKIKQAEKEIDLQKEALDLQRQYVDEITDYLAGDRQNMEKAFADLGISLTIDENGVITNFREVEEELLRQENELIDKYNDGLLDDDAYEDAQTLIDDAREYLEIYEETRDLYEEQLNALVEMMDDIQDSLLELTKTKIEIQIDISDEKLEWLEYMLEKIGDDAYQTAEAIAFLGDKTGETLNRIDIYQAGLEEILGRKGFSLDDLDSLTDLDLAQANFTQAEIDQIREWKSELMDANKELLKMREEVINKVIDGFDKLNEKVQNSYDNFNQYNDVLEKYKEITDLLGLRLNQQNKELLDSLGKATLANAQNQAASAKIIYETAKKAHEDAQKTYQEMVQRYGENSPEAQQWENLVNTTQDALDEAQNNWLDAWNNALQIAQDIYINHIEQITKTFEEQVSGLFGSLDYLQSAFDRADQVGTEYLQDFEKLYELNKLNRDIQKQIDDTNNIRDKQALKKLQKEINDLQEQGVKLSQYDVDALRKKFELEQARQALEDARNNKSEVRLHRDANGNWGYVYTAAEDEVADAEQEYENKLYEYQKLNDDYIKELQSRVLEIQQQYKEALAEIYNDTTLTDEQRQARIDELNNWKDAELAYFEQQLNNALKNQQDTLDLYYKLYGDTQAALADSWEETTLKMLTGASSVEEYINNVQQAMLDMLNNSANALSDYNNNVDDSNNAAGVNTEEYADHVTDAIGEIGAASEETQTQITALAETLIGEFTSALEAAVKWEDEYAQKMKEAIEQNEKFIQSLNEMIARLAMIESNDPELKIARANYMLAEAKHEKFVEVNGDIYDKDWEKAKKDWQEYLDKYAAAASYDTGGYTGAWGTGGKLAVLHEKENIFNADDTLRLLNAAEILRSIDLSAKSFAGGLGSLLIPQLKMTHDILEQNVHINASFPNVTDHNEIEEALNNLVNRASQYANRKNMSSMTFQDMYTNKF